MTKIFKGNSVVEIFERSKYHRNYRLLTSKSKLELLTQGCFSTF
jgi:hypothetical protein